MDVPSACARCTDVDATAARASASATTTNDGEYEDTLSKKTTGTFQVPGLRHGHDDLLRREDRHDPVTPPP
jgi:hypothetical protein